MLNCAIIMGRLTANPELRQTLSGNYVTSFTVAVERSFVKQGEKRQTDFIDVVAWGKTAEFVALYFQKGSMIAVQGTLQVRSYTDKNDNKRKAVEIIANEVSFCGSKESQGAPKAAPEDDEIECCEDNELPF